jgi:hypothetical protein
MVYITRIDPPLNLNEDVNSPTLDAILFDESDNSLDKDNDIVIFDEDKI